MISIIVPIYKVEKYLKPCIESIIGQTFKDIEVILVDDGSPDHCPAICDEYAKNDNRIKVIHKENGGLVSARIAGLNAANGEYVGFVDGDDWIEKNMYKVFSDKIEKYHPDMIVSEFYNDFSDKTEISRQIFVQEYYTKELLISEIYPNMLMDEHFYRVGISPCCWSKLFKKELLEKHLPFVDLNTHMGEDAAFSYPCLLFANSLCCVKTPLYHYRILANSMSRGYDIGMEDYIFLAYHRLKQSDIHNVLSQQRPYYMLYLANFLIRNESKAERLNVDILKRIIENDEIQKNIAMIELKKIPKHTAVLVRLLKDKNFFGLKLYTVLIGKHIERSKKNAI